MPSAWDCTSAYKSDHHVQQPISLFTSTENHGTLVSQGSGVGVMAYVLDLARPDWSEALTVSIRLVHTPYSTFPYLVPVALYLLFKGWCLSHKRYSPGYKWREVSVRKALQEKNKQTLHLGVLALKVIKISDCRDFFRLFLFLMDTNRSLEATTKPIWFLPEHAVSLLW